MAARVRAGRVGNRSLSTLTLFLHLRFRVIRDLLRTRLGVMHRAGWLRAYLANLALVDTFGHDGFGGELARLELRSGRLFFAGGLVGTNFDVLVTRQRRTALLLLSIGRADLYELGLGGEGLGNVGIDLRLIADGIGASVLLAHAQKEELIVSCPLGAVHATPRRWHELRIVLVEGSEFEDEKNVRLNPEMQTANG
jgi:hypothetical protein